MLITKNRIGPDLPETHWMLFFRTTRKIVAKWLGKCGDNVEIRPYVTLVGMNCIEIGNNVVLRPNTTIDADNDLGIKVIIEDNVLIAPGVYITNANHIFRAPDTLIASQGYELKDVVIKDGAWIGYRAIILPGVTIGKHSVVGAGSVVTRDVPDYCVAVGAPARVIKKIAT